MTERELRLAITGPAEKAGSRVGEPLIQALLAEMRARTSGAGPADQAIGAGALPLLSHALDQAWAARTGPDLELADYERVGGIQGAVAVTAEDAYARLSRAQQQAARAVFTRMVATSSDGTDTAIRLPVTDLPTGQEPGTATDVTAVLEAFTSRRLLTMAAGTVEISHESLLTAWPLLRDTWLAENHSDRIVRTRLHAIASEWSRESRNPSFLYRGSLLQGAIATAARISADPVRNSPLSQKERAFLAASTRASYRASRRRHAVIAGLAALTLAAAALAGLAFHTAGIASGNAANATRQDHIDLSRLLAADSMTADQASPVVARRLAVAAWRVYPTDQAKAAMLTLVAEQQQGTLPATINGSVTDVAFSPDGRLLATADSNGYVRLWNPDTHQPVGSPFPADTKGIQIGVTAVAFSPDGRLLATADADGHAQLWNAATGKAVATIDADITGHYVGVRGVAFSPDGRLLATADADGHAQLWNAATGSPVATFNADLTGDYVGVTGVAFSPDGKFLATADHNGDAQIWDTASAKPLKSVFVNGPPTGIAFSPDGSTVAIAVAERGSAQLWNLTKGTLILTSRGVTAEGVAFSPDGKLLAVADYNGEAHIWDTTRGKFIATFAADTTGDSTGVNAVAFSPDSRTLATADSNSVARLWSLTGTDSVSDISAGQASRGGIVGLAFSPDGKQFATADLEGYARIWDAADGKLVATFAADTSGDSTGVYGIAFRPDGKVLATADADGIAQLWNTANGKLIATLNADPQDYVNGLAFSPDGRLLATADANGYARLWNAATGQPFGAPFPANTKGTAIGVMGVAFSPDSRFLATADANSSVILWSVTGGKRRTSFAVGPPDGAPGTTEAAFSPDGRLLGTADSNDDTARLWDIATGQPVGNPDTTGASVQGITFSPDGSLIATADSDGTAQLWDTAVGQLIVSYQTSDKGVAAAAFSPDGRLLGTAGANGTVQLWRTPLSEDPYRTLCSEFGPPTRGEWTQYAAGQPFPAVC
jgi:WD40 repeat protein